LRRRKPWVRETVWIASWSASPIERFAQFIGKYGEESEAFRDLQLSFVDIDGQKLSYVDLMNHVLRQAGKKFSLASGDIPNLAAAYLTNYLRRNRIRTEYVNLYQKEKVRLLELLEQHPACVALTTTFYVINFPVNEMVDFIRQHDDKVKIVIGGPLVANHVRNYEGKDLEIALTDLGADIYVHDSQGEHTLAQLTRCLRDGGELRSVPNIYYHENGGFTATPILPESNSLDENYVDWEALSSSDLGATLQTRTARSCAFSCAFCNYPTRAGKLTLSSLETIEKELDSMHARGNVKNVVFIDDTFNVPLPRFKDICRLMIRKNYGFNWFSYFRCSNSDEEAIDLMAQSGCKGVFLGIESGSPRILLNMAKKATIEKYRDGIKMLHDREITTFGSYIIGFPGESEETVRETYDFIRETGADYYRAQLWYNEAGTPIQKRTGEFGIDGDGFVWEHATMDSLEAMEHIERAFLTIDESEWLPQWSFDFWIIPYLMGKGVSREELKEFMRIANQLLRLEVATVDSRERAHLQRRSLRQLVDTVGTWNLVA